MFLFVFSLVVVNYWGRLGRLQFRWAFGPFTVYGLVGLRPFTVYRDVYWDVYSLLGRLQFSWPSAVYGLQGRLLGRFTVYGLVGLRPFTVYSLSWHLSSGVIAATFYFFYYLLCIYIHF